VRPLVDLEIEPLPSRTLAVVGETVTFPLVLRSVGTQAVADARITIDTHPLLGLEVVGSGADCSGSSGVFECSFGTLESGAEVGAQLRVRSDVALWAMVQLHAHPDSGDEVRDNSSRSTIVEIRQAVDVQVGSPNVSFQAREGMERTDMLWLTSVGAYAATDVEARIELPEGVTAVTAYMEEGECTIADRLVRCSIDELSNSSRSIELTYVGAEPGTFSGSFTVSANDDADASNNSAALTFEIIPNTDAAVVLPEDRHAFIDDDRDWVISVVNNRYALPDSSLRVDINPFGQPDMTIVSAVPSKGTCAVLPVLVSCDIGTLDPN